MKKLIAVLMSLCLMLGAVAAFASEPTVKTIHWSDFEAQAAGVEGQFANVAETGLKMFVPAEFKDTRLSEESTKEGTFVILKSEKDDKVIIKGQLVPRTMDAFREYMEGQGVRMTDDLVLNGLNFSQFTVTADGAATVGLAAATEKGTVVVFTFSAANPEAYRDLFQLMAASIQRAD